MLDFTLESFNRTVNETDAGATPAKIARSGVDRRRAAATAHPPPSSTLPKRRRHDRLNAAKHLPLEW